MASAPHATLSFYLAGVLILTAAIHIGAAPPRGQLAAVAPLQRGLARGEAQPGVPRLDPEDAMANAAILSATLEEIPHSEEPGRARCAAAPRLFSLMVGGRLSRVRFSARTVCQLKRLKEISAAQPGFGERGLGEVAAFLLGRRLPGGSDVDISRVVIPPFRFTRDTLTFVAADLGPLLPGEQFIGTYHTHPEGDLEQGVLSDIDLRYMRTGRADFHGRVGALAGGGPDIDWLFDIVEPRDGDWNVYAHDQRRLWELSLRCETEPTCPLNELRLAGSPYYLMTRFYDEPPGL